MRNVLVIHETDHTNNEHSVIGVADSVETAQQLINKYYGEHREIFFRDIRDSSLEWEKVLELSDHLGEPYQVTICLEWFTINDL
jgi:hypothetical protein